MNSCCRSINVIDDAGDYSRSCDNNRLTINWRNATRYTNELSFNGKGTMGKVVCVYDRLMMDIVFPIIGSGSRKLYKWPCVLNYDCHYDLFTNNCKGLADGNVVDNMIGKVKSVGKGMGKGDVLKKYTALLEEMLLNKVVYITCREFNEHGIIKVDVFINGVNVMEVIDKELMKMDSVREKGDVGEKDDVGGEDMMCEIMV